MNVNSAEETRNVPGGRQTCKDWRKGPHWGKTPETHKWPLEGTVVTSKGSLAQGHTGPSGLLPSGVAWDSSRGSRGCQPRTHPVPSSGPGTHGHLVHPEPVRAQHSFQPHPWIEISSHSIRGPPHNTARLAPNLGHMLRNAEVWFFPHQETNDVF